MRHIMCLPPCDGVVPPPNTTCVLNAGQNRPQRWANIQELNPSHKPTQCEGGGRVRRFCAPSKRPLTIMTDLDGAARQALPDEVLTP